MLKPLLFLLLFPISCLAQISISGKVINQADGKPVPLASVFLSNATIGTKSGEDGSFQLANVKPGQYELVVSVVGLEPYRQNIIAANENLKLAEIVMAPRIMQLKEVNIRLDPNREANLAIFYQEFLGLTDNSKDCKILNPEAIDIAYNKKTFQLSASSDDFIIIENKALGYRLKYLLKSFVKDDEAHLLSYVGSVLFEELPGSSSQKRRWKKRRLEAYLGSNMHFLRSAIANTMSEDGFEVHPLNIRVNPKKFPDSLVKSKIKYYTQLLKTRSNAGDSLDYWQDQFYVPRILYTLGKDPLRANEFVKLTDLKNIFVASCDGDLLYVMYTKKHDYKVSYQKANAFNMPKYQTTVVTIIDPYALFDANGTLMDPNQVQFDGYWSIHRMADLLPVDYDPMVE